MFGGCLVPPLRAGTVLRGVLRAGPQLPALVGVAGPRCPCSASPLPMVAPRHGGRGFGRAVSRFAGLFSRLAPWGFHGASGLSPLRPSYTPSSASSRWSSAAPFQLPRLAPCLMSNVLSLPKKPFTLRASRSRPPRNPFFLETFSATFNIRNTRHDLSFIFVALRAPHPPTTQE